MKPVKPIVEQGSLISAIVSPPVIENKNQPSDSSDIPTIAKKESLSPQIPKKLTEDEANDKLGELQSQFEDGKYWNHRGLNLSEDNSEWESVTDSPCDHGEYGNTYCNRYIGIHNQIFPEYDELLQCLGFASLISDKVFGESSPITEFHDYNQLRIGDHIRLHENKHSMIVTEKTDEYISIVEVNYDYNSCRISWGRHLSWDEVAEQDWDATYFTRYEA